MTAANKAFAREVRHQLLTHEFLNAITALWRGQGIVFNDRWQGLAGGVTEHGQRTRKHHHRHGFQDAASLQQGQRRGKIAAHAEIKVGLTFAADGRRQMKDDVRRPALPRLRGQVTRSDHPGQP